MKDPWDPVDWLVAYKTRGIRSFMHGECKYTTIMDPILQFFFKGAYKTDFILHTRLSKLNILCIYDDYNFQQDNRARNGTGCP